MCQNLKFVTVSEKTNFFVIGPVVFAPGTQTYATELKKWTIAFLTHTIKVKWLARGSSFVVGDLNQIQLSTLFCPWKE
jgi:hypothetical protein